MKKIPKIAYFVVALVLVFGALAINNVDRVRAVGEDLFEVEGNPNCADLNSMNSSFPGITSDFGFKIDAQPIGTDLEFYLQSGTQNGYSTVLTGGAPTDLINKITLSSDGVVFDWLATLGIDAVIVKAQDSNVYVYYPDEAFSDTGLTTIGAKAISHIEFCYDYELTAEKTAEAEYTRTYTWDITKDFDGEYWKFIGDPATTHGYEVSVDQTVIDSDFKVTGDITVSNPTPFSVGFSVADTVDGTPATVDCGEVATLEPGQSVVCSYVAELGDTLPEDGTNTATVSTTHDFVQGATATAAYAFGDPTTVVGDPTVNVTDTNGESWTASGDATWTYTKDFVCSTNPSDYTDGFYSYTVPNTATITETGQSDDASVKVNCYAPVPSKDANTSYTRTYTWEITKDYDGEYWKFIGDPATTHGYEVSVDQTINESLFAVAGTITVRNPNPKAAMTVSISDMVGEDAATLDCGGTLVVPASSSATCDYSADLESKTDGTNTATVSLNSIGFDATAAYAFGDPTTVVGDPTVNVTDTNGESWTASGDATWTYTKDFVCSTNPSDYTDGYYSYTVPNTATITETGQSDDASVKVNCYAPVVSKTANAEFDRTYEWDVSKSATDPVSGYPGDTLYWTWTVTVEETYEDSNYAIDGTIEVYNPAPKAMEVILADSLDDGTPVSIDYCETTASEVVLIDGVLNIPAGMTATCYYSAVPEGPTATLNTATATINDIPFSDTADVVFVPNLINNTADIDDVYEKDFPLTLTAGEGPREWTETYSHTCSKDAIDYGADGSYGLTLYNTATVTWGVDLSDSASAETSYLCEAGYVDVLKLTNSLVNPEKDWQFALYVGPDGFGGTQVGSTSSTLGDPDGILDFGLPTLRPDTTYTICELGVPAGWASKWWLLPETDLVPYNPNADDSTPSDVGNRCVDFGAGTDIPVSVGTTVQFKVDNTYPGGDPRTPGYWKNWNRCTGGGQQYTADANGGWEEGYWLLEDVLDPNIKGGIVWDDILDDDFLFPFVSDEGGLSACEKAVLILDKRDFDGKKVASDPLHNLATNLLAAQLNFGAGACTTQDVLDAALAAETLLDEYNFNGYGHDKLNKKDPDVGYANELATYLDQYNNGWYCGSTTMP